MKKNKRPIAPPKLAKRFLHLFLRKDLAEEVEGDLEEKLKKQLVTNSSFSTMLSYWLEVINYIRPFAIRKSRFPSINYSDMLRHNFIISFRSFGRNKSTFFINLIGLSTGLACALLIYLWVNDELMVNKFHEKGSRLYTIMENTELTESILTQPYTPDLLAETMAKEIPEIEYAVGVTPGSWFGNFILSYEDTNSKAIGQYVSADFFNIFSFPLIHGNANQVLANKNSIVLSEALALRIFNTTEDIIGKTIQCQLLNFKDPVIVSGIFETLPDNTTEEFDFLLSFELWKELSERVNRSINWGNFGPITYVTLHPNTDIDQFNKKIEGFIKSKDENSNVTLFATPYADQYLYGKYENGVQSGGRIEYVRLFAIIAIFIVLIACINFMNLSTAKAATRIKEVGVKKAVGAGRQALIIQYLSESLILSALSVACALLLVVLTLPQFNFITGKYLSLSLSTDLLLAILGVTVITGIISGSYPALYLSGFNPATILKGKLNISMGENWARKGLVVFQFSLSIILITSVMVVYNQINFVQTKNLGYDRDNVIHFEIEGKVAENQETFLEELRGIPGVVNASSIATTLAGSQSTTQGVRWEGKNPDDAIRFETVSAGFNLVETLNIEVTQGRAFSSDYNTEADKIIFNEAGIEVMGLTDPIGKTVILWGQEKEIIGVVKDFHFESLHEPVKPLLIRIAPTETLRIMARIERGKERETIDWISKFYKSFNPGYSFDYKFLNQDYQAQYAAEQRVATLSKYFAGLAILISCLGLFGLAAFTAQRRLKEIGIRKVMGASEWRIIFLLSFDFTLTVLVAIGIAIPISYLITDHWLSTFAYHIELRSWYFATAGILALMIAWLTVGTQAFKASRISPTQCLKDE